MLIGNGFSKRHQLEADAVLCVPATLLARASDVLSTTNVRAGGQDCHTAASGAHTGDISAEMLKDAGAAFVIVGHSERRADHGEDDALVAAKAEAAWRAGLVAIICIGETRDAARGGRDAGGAVGADRRLRPGRRDPRQYRDRLRAGMGDRHRPDADRRRRRCRRTATSARCWAAQIGAAGGADAHSLRRLGQAGKRRRS